MTPSNDCPPHVFIISLLQTLLIIIIIAVHLSMYNKSCLLKKTALYSSQGMEVVIAH